MNMFSKAMHFYKDIHVLGEYFKMLAFYFFKVHPCKQLYGLWGKYRIVLA